MGWFTRWMGLSSTSFEDEFDKPIDPEDAENVSVLVKVRFVDGTENENIARIARNEIPTLVQDLIDREDVKEAWVYEEISYHHKNTQEVPMSTIALGAALGASWGTSIR